MIPSFVRRFSEHTIRIDMRKMVYENLDLGRLRGRCSEIWGLAYVRTFTEATAVETCSFCSSRNWSNMRFSESVRTPQGIVEALAVNHHLLYSLAILTE